MKNIDKNTYKLISDMLDNHFSKISNKCKKKFSVFLVNLVKFSKIFTRNCNHKYVYTEDINAALLSMGIKSTQQSQSGGNSSKYNGYCDNQPSQCIDKTVCLTGGSNDTIRYPGYCDNQLSQCVETQQVCLQGGKLSDKNKDSSKKNNSSKKYNRSKKNKHSSKRKHSSKIKKSEVITVETLSFS